MSQKVATVVRPAVRAFFDVFREPDNVLHATLAFPKPSLVYRQYSLFLKEVL